MASQQDRLIDSVPYDVWVEMAKLLDPPDLGSLQSTCERCREMLRKRTVWYQALQRMCSVNRVYYPSYPVSSMTLEQIMRAAIAPFRLNGLVQDAAYDLAQAPDSTPTSSSSATTMAYPAPLAAVATSQVKDPRLLDISSGDSASMLVPGGRYLVVGHCRSGFLRLWDLGPPVGRGEGEPCAPICVAEMELREDGDQAPLPVKSAIAVAMVSKDELRVAVMVYKARYRDRALRMLSIDLSVETPAFRSLGETFNFEAAVGGASAAAPLLFDGETVVFLQSPVAIRRSVILDFIEGWYAIGPPAEGKTVFVDNALVCIQDENINVWDTRPFLEAAYRVPFQRETKVRLAKVKNLCAEPPAKTLTGAFGGLVITQATWYLAKSSPPTSPHVITFDVSNYPRLNGIWRYSLAISRREVDGGIEADLRLQGKYGVPSQYNLVGFVKHTSSLSGEGFLSGVPGRLNWMGEGWSPIRYPWVLYEVPSGTDGEEVKGNLTVAGLPVEDGELRFVGFCMWTGRMLYTKRVVGDDGEEADVLHVLDLLSI